MIGELADPSTVVEVRKALRCEPPHCNGQIREGGLELTPDLGHGLLCVSGLVASACLGGSAVSEKGAMAELWREHRSRISDDEAYRAAAVRVVRRSQGAEPIDPGFLD